MSDWQASLVTLALHAPMHLGLHATGNLKQTRRYVPGRSLWGALVERIAKKNDVRRFGDYAPVMKYVNESIRFSYAYPTDSIDHVRLWPWGDNIEEFDWLYLDSYTSTALADGRSKEDGSLHETEFIAPKTRDGKQVYLIFHLWRRTNESQPANLPTDILDETFWNGLHIGGERGYGWGRVTLAKPAMPAPPRLFEDSGWAWTATPEDIIILQAPSCEGRRALAHVNSQSTDWEGRVEPVVGRDTTGNGAGATLSKPQFGYEPGAQRKAANPETLEVTEMGFWKTPSAHGSK